MSREKEAMFIRTGNVIYDVKAKTSREFPSINAAKRESRKLQWPKLGTGLLEVRELPHKRRVSVFEGAQFEHARDSGRLMQDVRARRQRETIAARYERRMARAKKRAAALVEQARGMLGRDHDIVLE